MQLLRLAWFICGVYPANILKKMYDLSWSKCWYATVTPVPKPKVKKEEKDHPKANRPIARIPSFDKLYEYVCYGRTKKRQKDTGWTTYLKDVKKFYYIYTKNGRQV